MHLVGSDPERLQTFIEIGNAREASIGQILLFLVEQERAEAL